MAKALGPASVVDTNVAVVAEGRSDFVSAGCTEACEEALKALVEEGVIVVDDGGKIVEEYEKRLGHAPGGVGARFFKHVWDEQRRLTDDLSIDVVQLCPEHAKKAGA